MPIAVLCVIITISDQIPHQVTLMAQDTLGSALSVSSQLPEEVSKTLILLARAAFVNVAALVFLLCAGISLLIAIAALILSPKLTGPASSN